VNLEQTFRAAIESRDPQKLCDAIPYAKFLGLRLDLDDDGLICRLPQSDEIIGNPTLPAIHGGIIGALLEATALVHLIWEGEGAIMPKTINMSIDFLRSAGAKDTLARGTITRQGRRVANVRVEAWQDQRDKPVAAAHGHFLIG
jgi:uncharacterized protein (TIGR00369 family)